MTRVASRGRPALAALTLFAGLLASVAAQAASTCPDQRDTEQKPTNLARCNELKEAVRHPDGAHLKDYEDKLNEYLTLLCHRDVAGGWKPDKRVRDTGPWIGTYADGKWTGQYYGTHAPVLIWYSPEMYKWLQANRPNERAVATQPVPNGAMMIKEMYGAPAAACENVDPLFLLPKKGGAAVMVRDVKTAHDGWFWGWYGWGKDSGWAPDWPADQATSPYPNMGFGQYCTNCHASAKDNQTFAALKNIKGEDGEPLVFLSQSFFLDPSWQNLQARVAQSATSPAAASGGAADFDPTFMKTFALPGEVAGQVNIPAKSATDAGNIAMPPATYDNVWVKPGVTIASQYVTSDQCIGCHSAGGTGLQFDMTQPGPDGKLINISPYGTWRGSPMGLAGRDPIFFAQLASETETFHRDLSGTVQDICLGCHGILGQRQFGIDTPPKDGKCAPFTRAAVGYVPFPANPNAKDSNYGALARDGISCAACHHMVLGEKEAGPHANAPQNKCVQERQAALNPGLAKFAKTFTGSFFVGPPDRFYGPFQEPKKEPMKHALGTEPAHNQTITSSEMCGTCHTVHLPVLRRGVTLDHTYEQTTYPEWAFSAYRTGDSPDGPLPQGSGPKAQSCQGCHMPNKDVLGNPYRSKIAAIQEYTNFPQAEHVLPAKDIDLEERSGFGKHTLVGLNIFLLKMADQFSDILGIRKPDPMLTSRRGIDSIPTAINALVDQAVNRTATVTVGDVKNDGTTLSARVTVINLSGHKLPSGVGFRRAFLEFNVRDAKNNVLWSSGKTNAAGVIVDENNNEIAGEMWWKEDCSARIEPEKRIHQPHYQRIERQNQAQIYQELVAEPPATGEAQCGRGKPPAGQLTTSFLSICTTVKDNRLLPDGFLDFDKRREISLALGAKEDMARDTDPFGVGDDPDYRTGDGSDSLEYRVPLAALKGGAKPAAIEATLYYQATPPFYLQDRFCTSKSTDTQRLFYVTGKLDLSDPLTQGWKLRVVTSGPVAVPVP